MTFIPSQTTLNNVDAKDIEAINYSITNGGAGTVYRYFDARTFREFSFQFEESGTGVNTLTFEASNDDVAQGSATYTDITAQLFSAASFTAGAFEQATQRLCCRWLRAKIVTSTGTDNNIDLTVRAGW